MFNLVGINFINMIKSIVPEAKVASGGKEIVIRCPFCGDSIKNSRHAHFYISVPQSENDIPLYHCKRISCEAKGMVTPDLLLKLGCADGNVLTEIAKHNSYVLNLPKYKYLKKIDIYPLKYNYVSDNNHTNQFKLNYINNRIGSNFTIADVIGLKIFLNLYDIINANRLPLTRHKLVCDNLDRYFIGFISIDNSYAGMRKVTDKELHQSVNRRYINYNLVEKIDDNKNFYVIPAEYNILDPTPVRIHIAEGQFDILSIFYNVNKCNRYQNIYLASGGKSYYQALQYILTSTGIINYEVHFYPDADVSDELFMRTVISKINGLGCNVFVHRNMYPNTKDYGVPLCQIRENIRQWL